MSKKHMSVIASVMIGLCLTTSAVAQPADTADTEVSMRDKSIAAHFAGPVAAAVALVGGSLAIGRLAGAACKSIARQPESGETVLRSMVISAGLIEGALLFALLICLLSLYA